MCICVYFVCLFELYIPVNNFSIILSLLPGFHQYQAIGYEAPSFLRVSWDECNSLYIKQADGTDVLLAKSPFYACFTPIGRKIANFYTFIGLINQQSIQ